MNSSPVLLSPREINKFAYHVIAVFTHIVARQNTHLEEKLPPHFQTAISHQRLHVSARFLYIRVQLVNPQGMAQRNQHFTVY